MTTLQPFTFEGAEVRTAIIEGEPWFLAGNVCSILDLSNVGQALAALDEDEKGSITTNDGTPGNPRKAVINEAGLYSLIFRSRKPEAKAFKRWVTHEVLPSIRVSGSYQPVKELTQQEQVLALARQVIEQSDQLALAAPKVAAFDELMDSNGLYSVEAAAKSLGYGRNILFRDLRRLGVLQGNNLPYQRYIHHFEVKLGTYRNRAGETIPTQTTWVRPSGLEYLRKKLHESQQAVARAREMVGAP